MKLIDHIIGVDDLRDPQTFLTFGDIHEGAAGVDYNLLRDDISCVKNNPNTYGWYIGDGTDAISKNDLKRFDFSAIHPYYIDTQHPERLAELAKYQCRKLIQHFEPIRDKLVFGCGGNHGEKYAKQYSYDVDREFAEAMGWWGEHVPVVKYAPGVIMLRLWFRDASGKKSKPYIICAQHHCGGGALGVDSNIRWMKNTLGGTWTNCDIYLTGHVHKRGCSRVSRIRIPTTGQLKTEPDYQWYGVTGSYLRTYVDGVNNYGEGRYRPADLGALRTVITPLSGEIAMY